MVFVVRIFYNPDPMPKYKYLNLAELLDLLVMHQQQLNKLIAAGQFRSKKYLRHRRCIAQIQNTIGTFTDKAHISMEEERD